MALGERLRVGLLLATACTVSKPTPDASAERSAPKSSTAPTTVTRSPEDIRREGNHLVGQPSPYLEQHAHNPVDWYPWGPEALAKAKREGKPIFLSIGYSTCHWCHVMEKESFLDDEVAAFLNEHFVSIKVDRERRPDVDAVYIAAVGAMGGSTGWPLNVFLTPDLEPFFGGTYFPRHGKQGRPGFLDVLREVQTQYATDGKAVADRGRQILTQIEQRAGASLGAPGAIGGQTLDDAMRTLAGARDPEFGGFGSRNKFPNTPLLLAELRYVRRTDDAATRTHLVETLEQMMRGGVCDHLGGAFHRYAVDRQWHVPHFEKTLYDNAQLAGLYIEAGRGLERSDFVAVGRAVLDELLERWQQTDGGFIVGFDADDPGGEGAYYTWTPSELVDALGEVDAKIVAAAFGVTEAGDPQLQGRSVLHRKPDDEAARVAGVTEAEVAEALVRSLPQLRTIQMTRPSPGIDDKELVGWNALAVIALADAARWLQEPRYLEAAERAGGFLLAQGSADGRLQRGTRQGESLGAGVLEDHALAGLALVHLHAATGDPKWLARAYAIGSVIQDRFYDADRHVLLGASEAADDLPVRLADFDDGVLPSGGSAAILFALQLGAISGDTKLYDLGHDLLSRRATAAASRPFSSGFVLVALDHATAPVREVVVAGDPEDPDTAALREAVAGTSHARILPVVLDGTGAPPALSASFPALHGKKALSQRPTAFVCERGRCERPTSDPAVVREQIAAAFASDAIAAR
jgi:hypothetical protein